MRTALVIGGSGQIGLAAVPALVADGWSVRALVRTAEGAETASGLGAVPVVADRHDESALDEALGTGVDALVDVVAYDDRDAAPLLARADRIGSAVVVSSAAVYVDGRGGGFETEEFADFPVPVTEDQPTVEPGRDTYATGKVALERAWLEGPVPTTVLRPGAIHGPGCRQPREWTFVKRVLDGRDVRVLAFDGASRFATTSTRVLGELVRLAAAAPGDRVLNAADPDAPTVAEIAAAVDAAMGVTSRTVTVPGEPVDGVGLTPWAVPRPVVLAMDRAAATLGYVAPGRYAETVPAAVEWLVAQVRGGADWREAFPGFVRMEAMGDFFAYAAEDRFLARAAGPGAADRDGS
ncbi:NAD(P)H-binding protein [Cellulomonas sp. DKR-3]|uniref:NAD(P)H-binding protein n=1 Tax=Cellulomonas fulva TaxID=2835530 RepID=A0ABS5U2E8_9CELL|nr:NAD(P)H-binding protein [Cellulomonas fulva]MBT0995568.1 NAD(P)H-binding protein [Cellulomonas fulva]